MRESVFNTEIVNSLRACGAWAYKISDSPASWTMKQTRFTPDKPCDIIGCYNGKFFAIEGKQIKKVKAFGQSTMRLSQIESLTEILDKGGRSFVFLNVRIKGVKGEVKQENRLIIFDWSVLGAAEGSIKKKDIDALPFIIGKSKLFDLREFLDEL